MTNVIIDYAWKSVTWNSKTLKIIDIRLVWFAIVALFGLFNMPGRVCCWCLSRFRIKYKRIANTKIKQRQQQQLKRWEYVAMYAMLWYVIWNDPFSAVWNAKMQIKLNSSIIMSEMMEWLRRMVLFCFELIWVVDLMRTHTQFGIFIAMKMDVNQFIYRENLRPTMLDNSNYPYRTPASTFFNSFFAYVYLRRHHHHFDLWFFVATDEIVQFYSNDSILTSLHPWDGCMELHIYRTNGVYVCVHACILKCIYIKLLSIYRYTHPSINRIQP